MMTLQGKFHSVNNRFVAAVVKDPTAVGDFEIIGQSVSDEDICQIY